MSSAAGGRRQAPSAEPGRQYRHGLVLGKFYPPHEGHHFLIETAARRCERLTVLVMSASVEALSQRQRVEWLRASHAAEAGVRVVGVTDEEPVDYEDDAAWVAHRALAEAALAREAILAGEPGGAVVDLVASSEPYGSELAARLGAHHLLVDLERASVPVSGTRVRADVPGTWRYLRPPARAGLARRVVVLGAESTGTTTVSLALAEALRGRGGVWADTAWVPEFGREYTEGKVAAETALAAAAGREPVELADLTWTTEDFTAVARRQAALEDGAAGGGSPVLVCDTDVFATGIWHERYVGGRSEEVERIAAGRAADLYLLTDDVGVPFTQDGLRDGEHLRSWMTGLFERRLTETGRDWRRLTGTLDERVAAGLAAVDELLARGWEFGEPLV